MTPNAFFCTFLLTLTCIFSSLQNGTAQCGGNCGGYDAQNSCSCDNSCWLYGDCCPDALASCPSVRPAHPVFPGGSQPVNPMACNTNTSICSAGVAGPFTFTSPGVPVSSCLEFWGPNMAYIVLYITQSGPLNMLINGNSNFGYLDVAVFNVPQGQNPCTAILSTSNQLGCNYADNDGGCNQFGTSFPCNSSVPSPYVTAGQTLIIVVENWSGFSSSFTLQLAPGGAQSGVPGSAINPPANPNLCVDGAPIQLTAQNGGGTWSGPGVSSGGLFNPSVAGIGTHTISYVIGQAPCQSPVSSIQLTVGECPCSVSTSGITTTSCVTATNTYSVAAQISFVNPPSTGQLIIQNCTGNQVVLTPPFTSPVTANISGLTATGNANCSLTAHFTAKPSCTVTAGYAAPGNCQCGSFPPITATFDINGTSCADPAGGSIDVTVTGGINAPFTYLWTPGNANTQDLDHIPSGNYKLVITDHIGCRYDSTVTVQGPVQIQTNFTDRFVCSGDSLAVNPVPLPGVHYVWTPPQYFFGAGPTFYGTAAGPGMDTVFVGVATDSTGACGQDAFRIFVAPFPDVALALPGPDTVALCPGGGLTLANTAGNTGLQLPVIDYLWNDYSIQPTLTVSTPGLYWLQLTNNVGCKSSDSVVVVPVSPPSLGIDSLFFLCGNTAVPLYGHGYDSPVTLLWSTGAVTDTAWVTTPGPYTLTASNDCGSSTVATQVVTSSVNPGMLPNIFTPNGDGANDVYDLGTLFEHTARFNVQVFNRWGAKVYDSNDPKVGWTGKNLSDGVYFMSILYTGCDNKVSKLSHTVTLTGK